MGFEERFTRLVEGLLISYEMIRTILGRLPLPIEVTGVLSGDWEPQESERQLVHCLALVQDLPLDPAASRALRHVIHDWLMVNDQMVILASLADDPSAESAEWRFEAVTYALTRTMRLSEVVAGFLGAPLD